MTATHRTRRGWAVGLPLVAVGLTVAGPASAWAGTAEPGAEEELRRAVADRDAMIADLMNRVEALEEEALATDLRRRAGAFGQAVAATVGEAAERPGPAPAEEPPRAAIRAALAAFDEELRAASIMAVPRRSQRGGGADGGDGPSVPGPKVASHALLAATVGGAADSASAPLRVRPSFPDRAPPAAPSGEGEAGTAAKGPAIVAWSAEPLPGPRDGSEPDAGGARDGEEERVDEALRALERALVQKGGLVLPAWAFEVDSEFSYAFDGSKGLRIVDGVGVVDQNTRRDTLKNSAILRLGLPWEAQLEVEVPYVVRRERHATAAGERRSNGSGLGDVEVGLATQLLRESDLIPGLLGSVRWQAATGESAFGTGPGDLALGSGFHAVSGQLTMVKAVEPLVFFGSISHSITVPDEKGGVEIDPGDVTGLSLGAILAAGPGTSLRFGLEQSFIRETEVDGRPIPGSDGLGAMLELGASAVLPFTAGQSLLSVTAGIGVTEDAPDLRLGVSLPYRF